MTAYRECDYFTDKRGDIYIVRGDLHPPGFVRAKLIYEKTPDGDRIRNNGERYRKNTKDEITLIAEDQINQRFQPLANPLRHRLDGIWLKIYNELKNLVPAGDIGIFGSTLLGFPIARDVDFIIYGLNNCRLLKQNIEKIKVVLAVPGISSDHINYQKQKFGASHNLSTNSFEKTLANKWCAVQIAPGISNTLMFGYKPEEISFELLADDQPGQDLIIAGEVLDDLYTNFSPRIFKIRDSAGLVFTIKTYYWAYHSCVKIGDQIKITGKLIDNNIILLNNFKHGIIIT